MVLQATPTSTDVNEYGENVDIPKRFPNGTIQIPMHTNAINRICRRIITHTLIEMHDIIFRFQIIETVQTNHFGILPSILSTIVHGFSRLLLSQRCQHFKLCMTLPICGRNIAMCESNNHIRISLI